MHFLQIIGLLAIEWLQELNNLQDIYSKYFKLSIIIT